MLKSPLVQLSARAYSVVDRLSLINMCCDPVIKARFGSGHELRGRLCCLGLQTENGVRVCLALFVGKSAPAMRQQILTSRSYGSFVETSERSCKK